MKGHKKFNINMPASNPAICRARRWSLTVWNLENFNRDDFWNNQVGGGNIKYLVIGKEIGSRTQRDHLQCYVEFREKKGLAGIKKLFNDNTLHAEKSVGNGPTNRDYCIKEGNFKEFGRMGQQGRRSDLENIRDMLQEGADLIDIAEEHPGDFIRYSTGIMRMKDLMDRKRQKEADPLAPEVIVYIGRAGSGKTHHAYQNGGRNAYKYLCQQSGKVYFDGYEGQTTIWFDEFSGSTMPFNLWCRLADKWGCRVETKGSSVEVIGLQKIIISTIEFPGEWWANSPRFLKDPKQLWRRLSKVYFVPGGTGYDRYYQPMLIDEDDWPRICETYLDNLQTMAVECEDESFVC